MSKAQAYPLTWPTAFKRTLSTRGSQFKTTLPQAMDNVEKSLELFSKDTGKKVENVVISSNFNLSARNPKDSGVAIYFDWNGISTCIAVDRYGRIEENLQAIHHCIEAERTKMRHGGLNLVEAAFRGYAALPPPKSDWKRILGIELSHPTLEYVETAYKRLAIESHPDNGGDHDQMAELNAAIKQAREELKGK